MSPEFVMTLGQEALTLLLLVSAPLLAIILVIGLVISVFQAITQVNEPTLSFVPKLVAAIVVLVLTGPWMLSTLVDYVKRTIETIPLLIQ